jgi:hypothetical protein
MEKAFDQYEVWFVTGAQLLYGGDAVIAVDAHSNEMVNGLNESGKLPVKVVYNRWSWFSVGLKLTGCILQDNSKHTAFNLWFTRNKHRIVHKAELHLKR